MPLKTHLLRLLIGLVVLAAVLTAGFALFMSWMPSWGATPEEVTLALPGDAQLPAPLINWTNSRTIKAQPEAVWQWLAQIGDTRAAFYSFTFIENKIGALTGAADYAAVYVNANTIHPEWQSPQAGDQIIQGQLKWDSFETGRWLLASSVDPKVMGWTWLWQIAPAADGKGTRLVNRIRIQPGEAMGASPVMGFFISNGAFIMEQRMMNGIKAHAEGWTEPPYQEPVEMALWFVALLAGIVGAVLFVARRPWAISLGVAAASVLVILVLTFAQPPVIIRVLLDAALIAGVVAAVRAAVGRQTAAAGQVRRVPQYQG